MQTFKEVNLRERFFSGEQQGQEENEEEKEDEEIEIYREDQRNQMK